MLLLRGAEDLIRRERLRRRSEHGFADRLEAFCCLILLIEETEREKKEEFMWQDAVSALWASSCNG